MNGGLRTKIDDPVPLTRHDGLANLGPALNTPRNKTGDLLNDQGILPSRRLNRHNDSRIAARFSAHRRHKGSRNHLNLGHRSRARSALNMDIEYREEYPRGHNIPRTFSRDG
jgi:hypothetical protein